MSSSRGRSLPPTDGGRCAELEKQRPCQRHKVYSSPLQGPRGWGRQSLSASTARAMPKSSGVAAVPRCSFVAFVHVRSMPSLTLASTAAFEQLRRAWLAWACRPCLECDSTHVPVQPVGAVAATLLSDGAGGILQCHLCLQVCPRPCWSCRPPAPLCTQLITM